MLETSGRRTKSFSRAVVGCLRREASLTERERVMQNEENVIHVKARRIESLKFRELALPALHDFR
jgi:hypothetical protein